MRISQEADYALRIVQYLSKRDPEMRCDVKSIALDISLPHRFAVKILRKLTLAEVTKSYRGAYGGYTLNHKPANISFLDVIEAIDGEIHINKCISDPLKCNDNRDGNCFIRNNMIAVNNVIREQFSSINFQEKAK